MTDPVRWLASLENAPPGASKLLSTYSAAPPMPPEVHARLLAKAAQLSTLKPLGMVALLSSKPAVATIAVTIAGAGALATIGLGAPAQVQTALVTTLAPVARVAHGSHRMPVAKPVAERIVVFEELAREPHVESKIRPNAAGEPASALPASALPASALPASALPASTLPASALPASALPASALPASALVEEAMLIDRARAALQTDPAATLRICQNHERRFPNGQLGSAREALTMRALRKLGRTEDARRHARGLLDRDPKSLHAEEASKLAARNK